MHRFLVSVLPLALLVPTLFADTAPRSLARAGAPVDAALVTAIDLSDSIMRHDEWLQFEGVARAVLDPAFLSAATRGWHGRIDFAVFTWSSNHRHRVIVPWTSIDGPGAALEVAALLRRAPRPVRFGGGDDDDDASRFERPLERRTDLSNAIRFGAALFETAPGRCHRQILNVIGNGTDNVDGGASAARDAALAAGLTINGVVLGDDPVLAGYFRTRVTGGAGSFVMQVTEPHAFAEVMLTKFLRDLIAQPAPEAASIRGPV